MADEIYNPITATRAPATQEELIRYNEARSSYAVRRNASSNSFLKTNQAFSGGGADTTNIPDPERSKFVLSSDLKNQFEQYERALAQGGQAVDPREKTYNGVSGFELYQAWKSGNYSLGFDTDTSFRLDTPANFYAPSYSEKPVTREAQLMSSISSAGVSQIAQTGTPQSVNQIVRNIISPIPQDTIPPAVQAQQPAPDDQLNLVQNSGVTYISPDQQNLRAVQKIDSYRSRAAQFKKRMF